MKKREPHLWFGDGYLPDALILLGLVLLGVFIALPVFSEGILLGWDSPGHLLKARFMVQELLPNGQWDGWFPYWHSGFDLFGLYPPGFYVFVATLNALFLGFVDLSTSFTLASVLSYALLAPACYLLLRVFGFSRLGALSGGVFSLLVGGRPGAGIIGTFGVGLIPNALGLTFLVAFFAAFVRAERNGTRASQAVAALAFGGLMLTHAFSAYVAVLFSALYLGLRVLRREMPLPNLVPAGGVLIAGLAVSAFWWVPALLGLNGHGYILGWLTPSLDGSLVSLFSGELVGNVVVSLLGVAGFVLAIWRRKTEGVFLFLAAAVLFWLSLGEASFLPLLDVAVSAQSVRFLGPFTVVWALLAAFAMEAFLSSGAKWNREPWTRFVPFFLGAVFMGTLAVAVVPVFGIAQEHIRTESVFFALSDVHAAMDWISENTPPSARFVSEYHEVVQGVYGTPYGTPHVLNQFLPLYAGRADVSGNFPEGSASSFGSVLFSRQLGERPEAIRDALIRFGVSYALVYSPASIERLNAVSGYSRAFQRGAIAVFRLDGAPVHPFRGSPGVRVVSFRAASSELEADFDAVAAAPVDVAVTFHSNWRAFVDGAPVALEKSANGLMRFVLPEGRHTVRLDFQPLLYGAVLLALGAVMALWLALAAFAVRL